ncbi:hypothetical protein BDY19DRAFT_906501 [Irpex rosettiformis]|uniref:Uncharacterized protein n=1 Tax=Irpex rosettiformis TaxID=378272 RepID=A0ACB8U2F7_9APHY|nr:hypothetical protein BDY19DRAFT_906501 [Irpex rosettiformis]
MDMYSYGSGRKLEGRHRAQWLHGHYDALLFGTIKGFYDIGELFSTFANVTRDFYTKELVPISAYDIYPFIQHLKYCATKSVFLNITLDRLTVPTAAAYLLASDKLVHGRIFWCAAWKIQSYLDAPVPRSSYYGLSVTPLAVALQRSPKPERNRPFSPLGRGYQASSSNGGFIRVSSSSKDWCVHQPLKIMVLARRLPVGFGIPEVKNSAVDPYLDPGEVY